jgi:hypothetical protein
MSLDKIARMLHRRPPFGRFREQLFWLVDLVYACKSSGVAELVEQARLVEDALGALGEYLETGSEAALGEVSTRLEQFAVVVKRAVKTSGGDP